MEVKVLLVHSILARRGEVSTPGNHRAWASLIWVKRDVVDVSFSVVRIFWFDKEMDSLSIIRCYYLICEISDIHVYV